MSDEISFFKKTFWDLWFQKIFRNIASVKYQWLALLYVPTIWGMFHMKPDGKEPWIGAAAGLAFLGGGFVTLALGRIITRTALKEEAGEADKELNTDK